MVKIGKSGLHLPVRLKRIIFAISYIIMRNYDKNSWKEKIDPNFDKPVKTYIKYLSQIENLPDDGQIRVQGDFIELIKKNPDFTASYNHEFKEEMFSFDKNIGLLDNQESKLFSDILYSLKHYDTFLTRISQKSTFTRTIFLFLIPFLTFFIMLRISSKICSLIKLAGKLPEEESRKFYSNKIKGFLNDIYKKPFFTFQKDFIFTTFSLFIRLWFIRLDESDKTEPTKEQIAHLKNAIVINQVIGFVFSNMSQIAHQIDMSELLSNIHQGDDKSLFKATVIDKGLINYKPIKNRIIQATSSGEKEFFNKLGKAIAKKPLERVGQHGKTYAVLKFFWQMELNKLTNFELYHFLEYCGLHPPAYPDAFDKFMQRHIK